MGAPYRLARRLPRFPASPLQRFPAPTLPRSNAPYAASINVDRRETVEKTSRRNSCGITYQIDQDQPTVGSPMLIGGYERALLSSSRHPLLISGIMLHMITFSLTAGRDI